MNIYIYVCMYISKEEAIDMRAEGQEKDLKKN